MAGFGRNMQMDMNSRMNVEDSNRHGWIEKEVLTPEESLRLKSAIESCRHVCG